MGASALVLVLGLLGTWAQPLQAEPAECVGQGADAACEEDFAEVSLVQTALKDRVRASPARESLGFPDLGDLRKAAEQAAGIVDDAVTQGFVTLGETMNKTLAAILAKADAFAVEVDGSAAAVQRGSAAMLAKVLKLNVTAEAEKYVPVVQNGLSGLIALWAALTTSSKAGAQAVGNGLKAVGKEDLAIAFDAEFQAALAEGDKFAASITKVKDELAGEGNASLLATSTAARPAATVLVQVSEFPQFFMRVDVPQAPAPESAGQFLAGLNETLKAAAEQAAAFTDSFSGAFSALSDSVLGGIKGTLSGDALSKVQATFQSMQETARAISAEVATSTQKFLAGVGSGVGTVETEAAASEESGQRADPPKVPVAPGQTAAGATEVPAQQAAAERPRGCGPALLVFAAAALVGAA